MKTKVKIFFLVTFVCFSINPAFSQDDEDLSDLLSEMEKDRGFNQEVEWQRAETFVITASKMEENINKATASITVITDRELRQMGARNLADALRGGVPGIGLTRGATGLWEIESI